MTYEIYRYIFIGAGIGTVVMLFVTILIFFVLDIRKVIGDLTGKNAQKAIKKIREENEQSGDKTFKTSYINRSRGKITDKINENNGMLPKPDINTGIITAKIDSHPLSESARMRVSNETDVLDYHENNETEVLSNIQVNETEILPQNLSTDYVARVNDIFDIEYEITFIHSDEIIM